MGIWRQTDDYKFSLIGKTELPAINTVGNITVTLPTPLLAEAGDFIGVFYSRDAEEGVVASATDETPGISIRELYTNYYATTYDEDFTVGSEFNLEKTTFEETKATFAIKAIMDYTSIGRKIILNLFCRNVIWFNLRQSCFHFFLQDVFLAILHKYYGNYSCLINRNLQ